RLAEHRGTALVVRGGQVRVQSLEDPLGDARHVAEPGGCGKGQHVRRPERLEEAGPPVAVPPVVPRIDVGALTPVPSADHRSMGGWDDGREQSARSGRGAGPGTAAAPESAAGPDRPGATPDHPAGAGRRHLRRDLLTRTVRPQVGSPARTRTWKA